MSHTRYFEVNDDVGLDPEGNPEPFVGIGVSIPTVTMGPGGEPVPNTTNGFLTSVGDGARIVKTDDPRVAHQLLESGLLHEVDPPTKTELTKAEKVVKEAKEKQGTHVDPEEAAASDAPAKTPEED